MSAFYPMTGRQKAIPRADSPFAFHIQTGQLTINNQQFTIINVTSCIFDNSLPHISILEPLLSSANVQFIDHSVKVGCASRLFRG
jgi:hypothetical protein